MNDFIDSEAIKKLDPKNVLGSTEKIIDQLESAWNEVNSLSLPKLENISNIVFCGMGASVYGATVIKALLSREIGYPTETVSDYHLPVWVNERTLVVLTSYSGTTEEVLSCADEALAMNARIIILTHGGPLADFAKKNKIPSYIFDGKLNYSAVPRLGNGYIILGLIGLLNKAGVISIEEHEITNAILRLRDKYDELRIQAIEHSDIFTQSIPVIIAAEHLSGNAMILRNQFNETSKTFSAFYLIPDLNHHLMEGLQFPGEMPLHFVVLRSENYSAKNLKRIDLTIDILRQNKRDVLEFLTSGQTIYDDFLEVLLYGSFLTLYLAFRQDQNPAVNPWVDYFKSKLIS